MTDNFISILIEIKVRLTDNLLHATENFLHTTGNYLHITDNPNCR